MKHTKKKILSGANNSMSMSPEMAEMIKKIGADLNTELLQAEMKRSNLTAQSAYVMEKADEFIVNMLDEGIHPAAIEPVMGKVWMTLIKARCLGDVPNTAATALKCLKKMIMGMTIAELQSNENKQV